MTNTSHSISTRQAALIGGLGYLAVFVVTTLANSFALQQVIVAGNAATTAHNITTSASVFRLGITGWIVVLMCDTLVAWALYLFFRPIHYGVALLAAIMRLLFVAIFAAGLLNLFAMLELLSDAEILKVFEPAQLTAQIVPFLSAYEHAVHVAFVPFGLSILALGYLMIKSGKLPRVLGVLLIIAAVGYEIDSFGNFLSPAYAANETNFIIFVAVPAVVSEFLLTLWLLVKGGRGGPKTS